MSFRQAHSTFPSYLLRALLAGFVWLSVNSKTRLEATHSLQNLGLHQVVKVKEKHWGIKGGYQLKLHGRSSPLFNNEPIPDKAKSLVMANSAYLNGFVGNHWFAGGMMRYSTGLSYTRTNHLEDTIDFIDHDSQTAFLQASYFNSSNWIARFGLNTARLVTLEDNLTQFTEFSPMLSLAKVFQPNASHYLTINWNWDYSFTDSPEYPGTLWTDDRLNHWSTGLKLQHSWLFFQNFSLDSFTGVSFHDYSRGINSDRQDTAFSAGTSVEWAFLRFFTVAGYAEVLSRHSTIGTYSFTNWDGGLKFNASFGF